MKINCAICLDLFTASAEVSAGPCGHVFHTECCLRWFETNKHTCPSCRKSCPEKQLRRLYFSEGSSDGPEGEGDVNNLYNKVDSLTFNLRLAEGERKKLLEERNALSAKNVALREEFKSLETRLQSARDDYYSVNAKLTSLKGERKKYEMAQKDLAEIRHKLELFKNIELVVNGSYEEVQKKLHEIGDYSQATKDLSLINLALKKELKNKREYEASIRKESTQKSHHIAKLKSELEDKSRENRNLEQKNKALASEVAHLEEELEQTKIKVSKLQEAIVSPSGDPRSSALNRLIFEHPAPMNLTILDERNTPPVSKRKSTSDLFDLSDDRIESPPKKKPLVRPNISSPCKEVTNQAKHKNPFVRSSSSGLRGILTGMASDTYRCVPLQPGKTEGLSFNGLGGHSKPETFPQPLKKDFTFKGLPSKKPKGVARPGNLKPKLSQPSSQASRTIDKFFSLDTP